MPLAPTHDDLTYRVEYVNDRKIEKWLWQGRLHSVDDRPARIVNDGEEQHWYTQGLRHRNGAPAIIYANGKQVWYHLDAIHRNDGPAKTFMDGEEQYYLHNKRYASIRDWIKDNPCRTEELVMMKMKYL